MADLTLSVLLLEEHVKGAIVRWRKNEVRCGNLSPELGVDNLLEILKTDQSLPDPDNGEHIFNQFLGAVAYDLSMIFDGNQKAFFQQLYTKSERWRNLLLTKCAEDTIVSTLRPAAVAVMGEKQDDTNESRAITATQENCKQSGLEVLAPPVGTDSTAIDVSVEATKRENSTLRDSEVARNSDSPPVATDSTAIYVSFAATERENSTLPDLEFARNSDSPPVATDTAVADASVEATEREHCMELDLKAGRDSDLPPIGTDSAVKKVDTSNTVADVSVETTEREHCMELDLEVSRGSDPPPVGTDSNVKKATERESCMIELELEVGRDSDSPPVDTGSTVADVSVATTERESCMELDLEASRGFDPPPVGTDSNVKKATERENCAMELDLGFARNSDSPPVATDTSIADVSVKTTERENCMELDLEASRGLDPPPVGTDLNAKKTTKRENCAMELDLGFARNSDSPPVEGNNVADISVETTEPENCTELDLEVTRNSNSPPVDSGSTVADVSIETTGRKKCTVLDLEAARNSDSPLACTSSIVTYVSGEPTERENWTVLDLEVPRSSDSPPVGMDSDITITDKPAEITGREKCTERDLEVTRKSDSPPFGTDSIISDVRVEIAEIYGHQRGGPLSEYDEVLSTYPNWPSTLETCHPLGVCPWRNACEILGLNGWMTTWAKGVPVYQCNHQGPTLSRCQMQRFASERYGWKAPSDKATPILDEKSTTRKLQKSEPEPTMNSESRDRIRTEIAAHTQDADSAFNMQVATSASDHESTDDIDGLGSRYKRSSPRLRPQMVAQVLRSGKADRVPTKSASSTWTIVENELFFDGIFRTGATRTRDARWRNIENSIPTRKPESVRKRLGDFFGRNLRLRTKYEEYCKRRVLPSKSSPNGLKTEAAQGDGTQQRNPLLGGTMWTEQENELFFEGIISQEDTTTYIVNSVSTRTPTAISRRVKDWKSSKSLQLKFKDFCKRRDIEYVEPEDGKRRATSWKKSDTKGHQEKQCRQHLDAAPRKRSSEGGNEGMKALTSGDTTNKPRKTGSSSRSDHLDSGFLAGSRRKNRGSTGGEVDGNVVCADVVPSGHDIASSRPVLVRSGGQAGPLSHKTESEENSPKVERSNEESRRKVTRSRLQNLLLDRRKTLGGDRHLQDMLCRELESDIERIDRELLNLYRGWHDENDTSEPPHKSGS